MRVNVKTAINRAVIAAHAIIHSNKKGKTDNKNVYIVFQQIFGDSIVIQNSLFEYSKIFSDGWKIYFLARPSVISFMKENLLLPPNIIFEELDFKKFLENYGYYKQTIKKYKGRIGTIIVPGTSFSAEVFSTMSDARRKVGLIRSIDFKKNWIMSFFYNKAYTEVVRPCKEDMMLQRHRALLNYLGSKKYKARLPKLVEKSRVIEGRYAVICPGSSKAEKCWPIEKFAEVADYLSEKYNLSIHLCGGKEEELYAKHMSEMIKNSDRLFSHVGTTSFSDWSAIVQHAEIVIGNDSATMHLAAAARARAVCIAGVYDKYQFFPYKVDELDKNDRLPITIIKDMPCEWCRTIGYDAGYGNVECRKRIESGQCADCINLITTEEVKRAVDELMKEELNEQFK